MLEINKSHIEADTSSLKNNVSRRIKATMGAVATFITIYSGTISAFAEEYTPQTTETAIVYEIENNDINEVVEIPEQFKDEVSYLVGKSIDDDITANDLKKIKEMTIRVREDSDLTWLNYCTNMETIRFNFREQASTEALRVLSGFPKLKFLDLSSYFVDKFLSSEDAYFLNNCESLKEVYITGFKLDSHTIDNAHNLSFLHIGTCNGANIEFTKFNNLKTLSLSEPYNAAIWINTEQLDYLKSHGVKIETGEVDLSDICRRLDAIVSSLDIKESETDIEKFTKIFTYVLDNLQYDSEVSYALRNNLENGSLINSFYVDGDLYGALEKDTQICGNYAALLSALCHRTGLDSYVISDNEHAWNIVQIDDNYYFTDATWADSNFVFIKETEDGWINYSQISAEEAMHRGLQDDVEWFLEDPIQFNKHATDNGTHVTENVPTWIELKEITSEVVEEVTNENTSTTTIEETTETEATREETVAATSEEEVVAAEEEFEDKRFKLEFNGKTYIIAGSVLAAGVLSAGGAIIVHKNKEEKRRRMINQALSNFGAGFDDGYGYGNDQNGYGYGNYQSSYNYGNNQNGYNYGNSYSDNNGYNYR